MPMRASVAALVLATAVTSANAWVAEQLDLDTVDTVWTYLRHKDCAGAARVLNEGVKKGYPSVTLLAGAMFEDGICLKQSWSRALDMFERAHAAGHPKAAARIIAGFATPAAGPDKAATLWWALKDKQGLPQECTAASAWADDADKFVTMLRAWPVQRLDACVYVAAVMAALRGDLEFSQRAAAHGLKGTVTATFLPADGRFDIRTEELSFIQLDGVVSAEAIRDRESSSVKREFERDIKAASDRAMRRYAAPTGIDPAWKLSISFVFDYVVR